jgi:hypothetical protein
MPRASSNTRRSISHPGLTCGSSRRDTSRSGLFFWIPSTMRGTAIQRLFILSMVLLGCTPPSRASKQEADAGAAGSTDTEQCGLGPGSIETSGVGVFRIGATPADVLAECPSAVDTVALDIEGNPQRALVLTLSEGGEIRAEVVGGAVWRVRVTTPAATTGDGLGVGTPLSRLLESPGIRAFEGEGRLFVTVAEHCGLSFRLSHVPGPGEHRGVWTESALETLPGSTQIDEVLVFGCAEAP